MKIRIFTNLITTIVALFVIWCVTPPEYPLAAKIILSVIGLCFIWRGDKLRGVFLELSRLVKIVSSGVDRAAYVFVEWLCNIDLEALEAKCTRIVEASKYRTDENIKKLRRLIRRIARWCDATLLCEGVSICAIGGVCCHYHNLPLLILLGLFAWCLTGILWQVVFYCTTSAYNDAEMRSTDSVLGAFTVLIQLLIWAAQIFITVLALIRKDEIVAGAAWEPFFTARLGTWSLGISPIVAVILVSAILFLFCFGNLCAAVNGFASAPET